MISSSTLLTSQQTVLQLLRSLAIASGSSYLSFTQQDTLVLLLLLKTLDMSLEFLNTPVKQLSQTREALHLRMAFNLLLDSSGLSQGPFTKRDAEIVILLPERV